MSTSLPVLTRKPLRDRLVRKEYEHRQAWHRDRRHYIGASDSPTLLGVGYSDSSIVDLWAEKVHGPATNDAPAAFTIGQLMEDSLQKIFCWKTGLPITDPFEDSCTYCTFVSPEDGRISATPDGFVKDGDEIVPLELKNVGQWNADEWENGGSPLAYQVQCQHQMFVTQTPYAYLMALIGGNNVQIRKIERNDEFLKVWRLRVEWFWELVDKQQTPPVDDRIATGKALAKLFPRDNGEVIALPTEAADWDFELQSAKAMARTADQQETKAANQIKAALGSASTGLLPGGGSYSWKHQHRAGSTCEACGHQKAGSDFRVLRRHDK